MQRVGNQRSLSSSVTLSVSQQIDCTCAQDGQRSSIYHHVDEQRIFTGTWVSLELDLALEMGYKVMKIHKVWHFQDKTDRLFRGYMFLKKKQSRSFRVARVVSNRRGQRKVPSRVQRQRRNRPGPRHHSIQCRRPNDVEADLKQFVGENWSTP